MPQNRWVLVTNWWRVFFGSSAKMSPYTHIGSTGNGYLGNYGPIANLGYHFVSHRGGVCAASRSKGFVHCAADRQHRLRPVGSRCRPGEQKATTQEGSGDRQGVQQR